MGFNPASLWKAPEVNPVNGKARSLPFFNLVNVYGRVFFFSWFGFMIAFWSWYAFPPLLGVSIKKDLHLTQPQILNSNIVALVATLLVRVVAGPACDRFGPRYVFAACLLIGAIPTALAGTIYNVHQLMAARFFIGILGGSFVPCQVWSTGFFDKNVVGTSNAIAAGLGNAGGGITYFLMPAIFDSLVRDQGLTPHTAWRVSYIVPFIAIVTVAILLVVLCPDTPTGKWADRHLHAQQSLAAHGITANVVDAPTDNFMAKPSTEATTPPSEARHSNGHEKMEYDAKPANFGDHEAQTTPQSMLDTARGEVVVAPSFSEFVKVTLSLQTMVTALAYFCSFGAELSINSILGQYYLKNFPYLGQTGTGNWAAMFGLLNVVFRPIGGLVSDLLYTRTHSVWAKKIWLHVLGIIMGAFLIAIGLSNPHNENTMFGLIAGMGFFLEAGNGANYALVPHVHPHANGIVSGITGAAGNLGGICFAICFRYLPGNYAKAFWIIGLICIIMHVLLSWIRPIPKGQVGGR